MSLPMEQGGKPRVSSRQFILEARECLEQGCRLRAGKKAWEAIACYLKAIGEQRGWLFDSHHEIQQIGIQLWPEFSDFETGFAIIDVYYKGYDLLYENQTSKDCLREVIDLAEEALPTLEALLNATPSPCTINTQRQLRRLMALTGNNNLQIGDTSQAGFSLKHTPDSHDNRAVAQ